MLMLFSGDARSGCSARPAQVSLKRDLKVPTREMLLAMCPPCPLTCRGSIGASFLWTAEHALCWEWIQRILLVRFSTHPPGLLTSNSYCAATWDSDGLLPGCTSYSVPCSSRTATGPSFRGWRLRQARPAHARNSDCYPQVGILIKELLKSA
eukprot:1157731-Pelagomonas_calceolata.AAC.6